MGNTDVAIRFNQVSFQYSSKKIILDEADFSIRDQAKFTIIGQNGAGKSTIFKLITGALKPDSGSIHLKPGATISVSLQVMPRAHLTLSVTEYFATAFAEKVYDLDRRIAQVLEVVHLTVPTDWIVGKLSGGQQARLLLAYALIQKPDILLLDEPTNNLDTQGIDHLIQFLMEYNKTVIVISHDAAFLNTFTEGVINLDVFTHKTQHYIGNYFDVVEEISAQIERERAQNARLKKNIIDRKEKVNFFSHKGGKMRKLASKMKEQIEESEEQMVDVRQEDKTIRSFTIPTQDISNPIGKLSAVTIIRNNAPITKAVDLVLRKKEILRITGPNGIGKTTLLEALAGQQHTGLKITPEVRVGYYRQDFSGLDFDQTGYAALKAVQQEGGEQPIFAAAGQFLLNSELLQHSIASFSEGQKGLLCYARFVLQQPGLLILDEPTNHINFRHLPIIAQALNNFGGAIILVSHDQEFVDQLNIEQTLDLETLG